jgi:hypothetical protein
MLPAGLLSLSIPTSPLPFSLFVGIEPNFYPLFECLAALLFPLFVVGLSKILIQDSARIEEAHPEVDMEMDLYIGFAFGVIGAGLMAIIAKWPLGLLLTAYRAGVIAFILIPVGFAILYVITEDKNYTSEIVKGVRVRRIPLRVHVMAAAGALLGFYAALFAVSAADNGWVFPYMLLSLWIARGVIGFFNPYAKVISKITRTTKRFRAA